MARYPEAIEDLIQSLIILPGVGRKTAERYVFHLLKQPAVVVNQLSERLRLAREAIVTCSTCFRFTQLDPCSICADPLRDSQVLCVVAETTSVQAIEQTGDFTGRYHVLGGYVDQLSGIGPGELRLTELQDRIAQDSVEEIILALNPDVPGETTALYVQEAARNADSNIRITRLARGLPAGSEIEFADDITLGDALRERRELE